MQQMQAANSVSSKLELPNNPNEYAASHQQNSRAKQQHLAGSAGSAQVAQLRSQSSAVSADANGNVNGNGNNANGSPAQLQTDNPTSGSSSNANSNGNSNSNLNANNNLINSAASQNLAGQNANQNPNNVNGNLPKEDGGKLTDSFDESFPAKDELEDEDEDEFNEWSDAPRPHNFDDNAYWIESNKIKYSSAGHEPIKQPTGDHLGQGAQSSYTAVSQQGSSQLKKPTSSYNNNKHSSTSPDFESTNTFCRLKFQRCIGF